MHFTQLAFPEFENHEETFLCTEFSVAPFSVLFILILDCIPVLEIQRKIT